MSPGPGVRVIFPSQFCRAAAAARCLPQWRRYWPNVVYGDQSHDQPTGLLEPTGLRVSRGPAASTLLLLPAVTVTARSGGAAAAAADLLNAEPSVLHPAF